jgi:alkylation response protein AidB-like acyl-CoA dehydrogenase
MRQPGVTVRPIRQLTGTSEFNEVFFDGARTDRDLVVGQAGDGWRVARAAPYDLDEWQRLFLFSRADTIYGGSDEIQRGIIAERALGLPRQARA